MNQGAADTTTASGEGAPTPLCDGHVEFVLRMADSAFVLSHRLSEWVGRAPMLEEEMALANTALDLLGQASHLYDHAAALEVAGRSADDMAYLRTERDFRNLLICELARGDFAFTYTRQVLFGAWAVELWSALAASADQQLAAIAGKALPEARYHLRHAADWLERLAGGTDESRARTEAALEALWPYAREAFHGDAVDDAAEAAGVGPNLAQIASSWQERIDAIMDRAGLDLPVAAAEQAGGRSGIHTEALGPMLAEIQSLHRALPGVAW